MESKQEHLPASAGADEDFERHLLALPAPHEKSSCRAPVDPTAARPIFEGRDRARSDGRRAVPA